MAAGWLAMMAWAIQASTQRFSDSQEASTTHADVLSEPETDADGIGQLALIRQHSATDWRLLNQVASTNPLPLPHPPIPT